MLYVDVRVNWMSFTFFLVVLLNELLSSCGNKASLVLELLQSYDIWLKNPIVSDFPYDPFFDRRNMFIIFKLFQWTFSLLT